MDDVEGLDDQNLEYHKIKELFEDRDSDIFDTILLNGPIETIKKKLKLRGDQVTHMHPICRSFFHLFSTNQTMNCPNFIHQCMDSYSTFEKVIMYALISMKRTFSFHK